jgi:hypothetical protein
MQFKGRSPYNFFGTFSLSFRQGPSSQKFKGHSSYKLFGRFFLKSAKKLKPLQPILTANHAFHYHPFARPLGAPRQAHTRVD